MRLGLFGSFTRGQQSIESDVDLLIAYNRFADAYG